MSFALVTLLLSSPGLAALAWPDLSTSLPYDGGGSRDAAVVVGISDYDKLPDIEGAADNASDWYLWLKKSRKVPVVKLLRDGEATRDTILAAAADAARLSKDGGTTWFVFIGHGAPAPDGTDGVLVGADARQAADSMYARSVYRNELSQVLSQGAGTPLLILDSCFSGQTPGGQALLPGLQPLVPAYAWKSTGATVLTAARGDQFAGALPGAARPAFSYLLLGALRGWGDVNGDRRVSASEAVDWVSDTLLEIVNDHRQEPMTLGDGADPVLSVLTKPEPAPDLASLVVKLSGPEAEGSGATTSSAVQVHVGSQDLMAMAKEAEEARRKQQAFQEAKEKEFKAQTTTILGKAKADWVAIAPAIAQKDDAGKKVCQAFVDKYGTAKVTVAGETRAVDVPEVAQARAWLQPPATESSLPKTVPTSVIDIQIRNNKAVKTCFLDERKRSGELPSVTLLFQIQPSGTVTGGDVRERDWKGSDLERCLVSAARTISFPAFSGPEYTVAFPFKF